MRIEHITIDNFKKIEHMELRFQKGFNLIIGDNSTGKTSVLEAISVALGGFLAGIDNIQSVNFSNDEIRRVCSTIGDGSYNIRYATPITVDCTAIIDNTPFHFVRRKNSAKSSRTTVEPRDICKTATRMASDDSSVLPVISYQSAARMWSQKKNKWNDPFGDDYSRVVGYTDCLDESSNTKMLTNWFRKMEQIIWQNNKTIGEYENAKRSTAEFIKHMTGSGDARVYYDKRSEELMCMIDDERLPLRFFSAGYRSMIGMVLDIACRMSILNPELRETAYMTDGVVLIDEIDLHLHPKWQWNIISALEKTFPNVQFIATTHSPIILSSYKGDSIININDGKIEYTAPTYGYKVTDILNILQDSNERVPFIQKKFDMFYDAIDSENIEKAEQILDELKSQLKASDASMKNTPVLYYGT